MESVFLKWLIGYSLTTAANFFIKPERVKELLPKLEAAVNNWAKEYKLEYTYESLFRVIDSDADHVAMPAQAVLKERLSSGNIPDDDVWFNALVERWKKTRESLPSEERHCFYNQDLEEVEQQLRFLARKLERVCAEHPELSRTTLYYQKIKPRNKGEDICNPKHCFAMDLAEEKIGRLTSDLSREKAEKLEGVRELYREGKRQEAYSKILALKTDETWKELDNFLKAKITKIAASYTLNLNKDIAEAENLVAEALNFDSKVDVTVINTFIEYHKSGAKAALSYLEFPENIDAFNFKLALFLELGELDDLIYQIKNKPDDFLLNAESKRLYALGLLCQKDLFGAQVEIQKALNEQPKWQSVRIASAFINYYSALSPIVIPERLLQWPEAIEWDYVKRDDISIESLMKAESVFKDIAKIENDELRAELKLWQLACLANNAAKQSDAIVLYQDLLSADPGDPRLLEWALIRGYNFDFSKVVSSLNNIPVEQFDYIPRVIALIVLYLNNDTVDDATNLLNKNKDEFSRKALNDLWIYWHAQILLVKGNHSEALKIVQDMADSDTKQRIHRIVLRGAAKKMGEWDPYIKHLEDCYDQTSEGVYLYECCSLKASFGDWNYVASRAKELLKAVGTSSVLEFVVNSLYQATPKQCKLCLELMDDYVGMYKNGELPSRMRRIKMYCQTSLGLLPQALMEAEETFKKEESTENLVALMNMQFNVGDREGLVYRARQLIKRDDVEIVNLIRVAGIILSENKELARKIWRKAAERISEDEGYIGEIVSLGYSLGLDEELDSLLDILSKHAANGEGVVKLLNLEEMKSRLVKEKERRDFLNPTFKVEVQQRRKRPQAVFCSPDTFWACC